MSSLARWCFRRRGVVLSGWVGGLVALALLVFGAGTAFTDNADMPDSESATAYHLLGQAGSPVGGNVVRGTIVWHTGDVGSGPVRERVSAVLGDISAMPGVKQVVSPYAPAGAAQLNPGAGTAYATVVLDKAAATESVVQAAERLRAPGLDVQAGGQAFTEKPAGSNGTEAIGILAALLLLLLVVMLASHVVDLAATSLTMGALIGLGVGIDYALFIVNRHRKALRAGAFRRLIIKADLPPVRFHDLRHGAATLSLAAGNDLKTVQALLGHASIVLTADTYTSVLPSLAQACAEATASLVRRAGYDRGRKICRSGAMSTLQRRRRAVGHGPRFIRAGESLGRTHGGPTSGSQINKAHRRHP